MSSVALGKVGVLYGGRSAERDVSLMSGKGVHEALVSKGVDAHLFDMGKSSLSDLAAQQFDRVFIALHGRYGEDGSIQGALELLGIPYTGSGVMACALSMDKIMTKRVWLENPAISTPKFCVVRNESDLHEAANTLGYPFILKAPHEGSSIGLIKIENESVLFNSYAQVGAFDEELLAEQFIVGRELTVPVLGKGSLAKAFPIIEISAPEGKYDYQNKYFTDDTRYTCPAEIPENVYAQISQMVVNAYNAVQCEGWARVDVMLSTDNRPYLLEINTSPGMTSHSLVPMSAKAKGMSYADLCVYILEQASCKIKQTPGV